MKTTRILEVLGTISEYQNKDISALVPANNTGASPEELDELCNEGLLEKVDNTPHTFSYYKPTPKGVGYVIGI